MSLEDPSLSLDGASESPVTPTYRVTIADEDVEFQSILNLAEEALRNHPWMKLPVDPEHLNTLFHQFVFGDPRLVCLFILWFNDKPVGFLAATASSTGPTTFGVKIASELCWYVTPEHRGAASKELVVAYEYWVGVVGAKYIVVSHFNDETGKLLDRLYTRMGYKIAEVSYLKVA